MHKPTYVASRLFDAIFDEERNAALNWDRERAPLALPVFHHFIRLCDEDLLKRAWLLLIAEDFDKRGGEVAALLRELHERSRASDMDAGTKRLFDAALGFGIWNPRALDFGSRSKKMYGPNVIGFGFVLAAIARRLREARRKDALSIKVDRQSEFNAAQAYLHDLEKQFAGELATLGEKQRRRYLAQPFFEGADAEDALRLNMPRQRIEFVASESSIGLQLADIYLWLMRRGRSGTEITGELEKLGRLVGKRKCIESISLEGMQAKWSGLQKRLPPYGGVVEPLTESLARDRPFRSV